MKWDPTIAIIFFTIALLLFLKTFLEQDTFSKDKMHMNIFFSKYFMHISNDILCQSSSSISVANNSIGSEIKTGKYVKTEQWDLKFMYKDGVSNNDKEIAW